MALKSATSSVAHKLPVALFIAAASLFGFGLVSNATHDDQQSLPDPAQMALLSRGRIGTPAVVEFWRSRVAATPSSPTFRAKLAGSMLALAGETGDLSLYPRAEAVARQAVDRDPTNESANLALASALAGQHEFGDALDLAQGVRGRAPRSVGARIAAADANLELGNYDEATELYAELGLELPGVPSILSRQAHLAALTGGLDRAVELARQALVGAGAEDFDTYTSAFYWFQLANYQYQEGRYDDAAATLRSALAVEPRHLGSIELLGKVLVAQGRYDEATALYEDVLQRTNAADLRGELAKLYRHAGRTADADRQLAIGIDLAHVAAAKYPAERRHLIGFLADIDPAFALELARDDLALRSDVQTYGWLAWALLQDGQPEQALEYLAPALRLGTEDAWLLYQAGSVYAAVGDVAHARPLLAKALALNPQFDLVHAERARQLLASLPAGGA
jgi:tetratricopeptide (TPR) repeat protein